MKCECQFSRVTLSGHCLDCGGQKDYIIESEYVVIIHLPFGRTLNIELLRKKSTKEQNGQ